MTFNKLKFIELPLKEQNEVLRRAPGEGANGDWGLRQSDFEEILNDCSTNSLVLNNINSSN